MTEVAGFVHGSDGEIAGKLFVPEGGSVMVEGEVVWEDGDGD
jgi:hypothetical protein